MNKVDKEFSDLVGKIKKLSQEELEDQMIHNFSQVPIEIQKSIEDYFKKFSYWGSLSVEGKDYTEIKRSAKSLKEHLDDYIWLYEKLKDYRSKKLLLAIMKNWYEFNFGLLKETIEICYPHYFDLDIVKCTPNEVIADLGAYTGDTVLSYIDTYGMDQYKKIYCYEMTEEIYPYLEQNVGKFPNIEIRKKAVSNKKENLYYQKSSVDLSANTISRAGEIVEAVSLDEDISESISLIKMDIEGYEQKALEGAKKHIQMEQPKLLVSVYHNHEDIWKIPKMIEEIKPGYQFYLRNHGGPIFPTEIVLLAIYSE